MLRAVLMVLMLAGSATAFPASRAPFDANDPLAAEYGMARAAVDREDWPAAESTLRLLVGAAPDVAEVWSLYGLSLRKQGRLDAADRAYAEALALDPDHLGAIEYLGELRLQQGRPDEAKALLARLIRLCPSFCEERMDLEAAIAEAGY